MKVSEITSVNTAGHLKKRERVKQISFTANEPAYGNFHKEESAEFQAKKERAKALARFVSGLSVAIAVYYFWIIKKTRK